MMKVSGIILVILVCTIVLIPGVSAKDNDTRVDDSGTPAGDLHLPGVVSPGTAGTITRGETDWYSVTVPTGAASITADLDWGYAPDSLSLAAIAPDGTIGPFDDASDGVTNGRVFLTISRTGGIAPGTWKFRVHGAGVPEIRRYKFVIY
jgi:hypothetical protein